MPDPVRCSADPAQPNSFSCEPIVIGPEPSVPAPLAAPAAPPAASPAVVALVKRFEISTQAVHAAAVSVLTTDTALHCIGQETALAILVIGAKFPVLAMLGGVKASLDLTTCVSNDEVGRQLSADVRAAEQSCLDDGGTPTGMIENRLTCLVSEATP